MHDDKLRAAPFNLDTAAIAWVHEVFGRLSPDEKIGQLFNLRSQGDDQAMLAAQQAFRPGAITRVPGPDWAAERAIIAQFNAAAPAPLLVSADLEGSRMSLAGGTEFPNPLALAAIQMSRPEYDRAGALAPSAAFDPEAFLSALKTAGLGWDVQPS